MHASEFVETAKINYKTKEQIIKFCIVLDYNKNIAGIGGGAK